MKADHHMLVAIDDSEASHKAIEYVAGIVADAPRFRIRLFHVLPHIPTGLLEHGGCEPGEVCVAARELDEGTRRWRERREAAAQGLIDDARQALIDAGVQGDRIEVRFAAPLPEETVGQHVLRAAIDHGCDTVVVGRAPRSWVGEWFHRHTSEALLRRKARGLAVWIVT